jgi:hypothetical protein
MAAAMTAFIGMPGASSISAATMRSPEITCRAPASLSAPPRVAAAGPWRWPGSPSTKAHGGPAVLAQFPSPSCIAVDGSGNLYVGDSSLNAIQQISPTGVTSLIAGSSGSGGSTDGTGSGALFNQPAGITINNSGVLFVADTGNAAIRKITPFGVVTTITTSTSPALASAPTPTLTASSWRRRLR